jgi:hypothetical protein
MFVQDCRLRWYHDDAPVTLPTLPILGFLFSFSVVFYFSWRHLVFHWMGMVFKHIPKTTDKTPLGRPLGIIGPSARVWKELTLNRRENVHGIDYFLQFCAPSGQLPSPAGRGPG